ncbi:hypothetical protein [Acinetobacter kanungonis]|uniref:hypothetical protein n=1 Tax=Acinetobacter kanungonis TaxID=2699469 RepID=UPI001379BFA5|nr:hypothetical protein [Acinetobacter kanungonis]NCI79918.1 hypothetical protein [Acinetobacter kanungonis]
MKNNNIIQIAVLVLAGLAVSACDSSKQSQDQQNSDSASIFKQDKAEVLPYLHIQQQPAKIALPFCETKNCIDIDIQTLVTQDQWLNDWMAKTQAMVIQDQIGLKQNMSLQQAVNAYVKKSDDWQAKYSKNPAYQLSLYTRIAYQRNEYVLLQVGVDSKQEEVKVNERYYFAVADRKKQQGITLLDIIEPKQQVYMNELVQKAYQDWLKQQTPEARQKAPKKLYWGQADWFFDSEGIGLHYRSLQIVDEGKQLDIYLTKAQTQQVVKADIYRTMF